MISYEEALERVLSLKHAELESERLNLAHCLNRVVSVNQYANMDVPPFSNSAMDGYAINSTEYSEGEGYSVTQRIAAGTAPDELKPGTIARIFTGAPIPPGADAVVIQENAVVNQDGKVMLTGNIEKGSNVRVAGDDIKLGSLLLEQGRLINSRAVGLLANTGVAELECYRRLRVALLATGDELRNPGEPLEVGQIYNSNYYMLRAELQSLGIEVVECGACADDAQATRQVLEEASNKADVVMTIGGMSVGEEDHVRGQAEALGELDFWRVAIKPGKPLAFGTLGNAVFFGLPGNPVSSFVTYFLFARPLLKKMMGLDDYSNQFLTVTANFDYLNKGSRTEFVRVQLKEGLDGAQPAAELFRTQSSGVLSSLTFADALAIIEAGSAVSRQSSLTALSLA